jgi:hypothetical protein
VDLATMTMDELHGTLTTYEMRKEKENLVTNEETFKAYKKTKKNKNQMTKSNSSNSDVSKDYEEVANFLRRMKRGTEKYKGKILLIYFDFYGIGHFSNKFPHKKNKIIKEDDP